MPRHRSSPWQALSFRLVCMAAAAAGPEVEAERRNWVAADRSRVAAADHIQHGLDRHM